MPKSISRSYFLYFILEISCFNEALLAYQRPEKCGFFWQGVKHFLGQLGTDLKVQAKFDLLRWQDQICLNFGFVAGLEFITWGW